MTSAAERASAGQPAARTGTPRPPLRPADGPTPRLVGRDVGQESAAPEVRPARKATVSSVQTVRSRNRIQARLGRARPRTARPADMRVRRGQERDEARAARRRAPRMTVHPGQGRDRDRRRGARPRTRRPDATATHGDGTAAGRATDQAARDRRRGARVAGQPGATGKPARAGGAHVSHAAAAASSRDDQAVSQGSPSRKTMTTTGTRTGRADDARGASTAPVSDRSGGIGGRTRRGPRQAWRVEVGPEAVAEVQLGVRRLPDQEVADAAGRRRCG